MPALKSMFSQAIYLQPLTPAGAEDHSGARVVPTHFKAKFRQDDTLVVGFAPYTLVKGTCYKLTFQPATIIGGVSLHAMVKPEVIDSLDLHVCASACECDYIGTAECLEDDSGAHQCLCHPHFQGEYCEECADGYYRNEDGFCELGSVCADLGGDEYCSGHGTCYQEGPVAVCDCDPGFADDGLVQCGRCADPLMKYPLECANRRNWVL